MASFFLSLFGRDYSFEGGRFSGHFSLSWEDGAIERDIEVKVDDEVVVDVEETVPVPVHHFDYDLSFSLKATSSSISAFDL